MYRSIHENKRTQQRADRNFIFLMLFAFGMIWAGVQLSEMREERLANGITPSAEAATEVTRQLCVEINSDDYLVVCPE